MVYENYFLIERLDDVVHGNLLPGQIENLLLYIRGSSNFSTEREVLPDILGDGVEVHYNILAMVEGTPQVIGHIAESGYFAFDVQDYKSLSDELIREVLTYFR